MTSFNTLTDKTSNELIPNYKSCAMTFFFSFDCYVVLIVRVPVAGVVATERAYLTWPIHNKLIYLISCIRAGT